MFMYRSTLSRSKREDKKNERCRRTTHDVWLSDFYHGTYPRCEKRVVFTIRQIYFSLLLLLRCLITRFSPRHNFNFFIFYYFSSLSYPSYIPTSFTLLKVLPSIFSLHLPFPISIFEHIILNHWYIMLYPFKKCYLKIFSSSKKFKKIKIQKN